jgi:hypothetical protein
MATAIISTYTPDGFLIAADGRVCNDEDLSVVSDTTQKIFRIDDRAGVMACSMAGTVGLTSGDSDQIVLDLQAEAVTIATSVANRQSKSLYGYAVRLSKLVNDALEKVKSSGVLSQYPTGGNQQQGETGHTIARLLLDGYYHRLPARVRIRFSHVNQKLSQPQVYHYNCPVPAGSMTSHGSQIIARLLFDSKDERFLAYRVKDPNNTGSVILQSRLFIAAHSDPQALLLDERTCRCVGGHVHIASITPSDGFQWVAGYEPLVA